MAAATAAASSILKLPQHQHRKSDMGGSQT